MTRLERPVTRRTDALVIKVAREGVYVRESGRRTWYGPVAWGRVYLIAARDYADAMLAAKPKARRAKTLSRRGR